MSCASEGGARAGFQRTRWRGHARAGARAGAPARPGGRSALGARGVGGRAGQAAVVGLEADPGRAARRRRRSAGDGRPRALAGRRRALQRRLRGQQGVDDGADRHDAEARLVLALLVVETLRGASARLGLLRRARRPAAAGPADARRRGEGEDRDRREGRAERRHAPGRASRQTRRGSDEQGVADDAAEPGRQRPASRRREAARPAPPPRRLRRDRAPTLIRGAGEPPLGHEPPAPEGGRRQRRDAGEAEHLHDDVGGDRARTRRVDCGRGALVA